MEEIKLVQQAQKGDSSAFEQLVLSYQKRVYNLALRMVCNPDDAYDVAQEAFFKAWRSLPSLKADAAFSTWLFRLTSNECIDFLRRAKRQKVVSLTVSSEEEQAQLDMPDPAPSPEERVITRQTHQQVLAAIDALPTEHRQILTLRILNDMDYRQIAAVLGIAEGTVKSRLSRARENLRKNLDTAGNNPKPTASIGQKGGKSHAE